MAEKNGAKRIILSCLSWRSWRLGARFIFRLRLIFPMPGIDDRDRLSFRPRWRVRMVEKGDRFDFPARNAAEIGVFVGGK
jgi:hypothetical protein